MRAKLVAYLFLPLGLIITLLAIPFFILVSFFNISSRGFLGEVFDEIDKILKRLHLD